SGLVDARDDATAGTHAERMRGEQAALRATHELITRRSENPRFVTRPVATRGHEFLRMLDAHADLERLRFDGEALVVERAPRVACAVSRREHDTVAVDLTARRVQRAHATSVRREHETFDARVPHELHTELFEMSAQMREDTVQLVRSDVRAAVERDRV